MELCCSCLPVVPSAHLILSPLSSFPSQSFPTSFTFSFPLISAFQGSLPVFHLLRIALKHLSYLSFEHFLSICSSFYLPTPPFSFLLLFSLSLLLTSSPCLCIRINSQRKCRNSMTAPKRAAPRRRLKRSQTLGCRRAPILMPAKQKRTKTKPSPFWSASRPWR